MVWAIASNFDTRALRKFWKLHFLFDC